MEVLQGDPLSLSLFKLILESIVWKTNFRYNNIMANQTQLVAYVDDETIMINGKATLIKTIERLDKEAKELGLKINRSERKYMG